MVTEIIMDIVYGLLTKSNSYTVHKKVGLNFFLQERVSRPLFF
jgi:hypothetical protein